jgi:hypothetical protein
MSRARWTKLFIEPRHVRGGVGRAPLVHAIAEARRRGAERLTLLADPNAAGFYERNGAVRIGEAPSDTVRRPPDLEPERCGSPFLFDRVKKLASAFRRRERRGVYLTNLALAVFIGGLGICLGYARVAAVQLPIMVIASIVGVWLFSIQHRFEYAQWMPDASWSFSAASLGGTSHLRRAYSSGLPAISAFTTCTM